MIKALLLFPNWCKGLVRISGSRWVKNLKLLRLHSGNCMVIIQTYLVHRFDIALSHMLKRLFTEWDTWTVSSYNFVDHVFGIYFIRIIDGFVFLHESTSVFLDLFYYGVCPDIYIDHFDFSQNTDWYLNTLNNFISGEQGWFIYF